MVMHVVVCIKQVPDSSQIRVHPVTNTIMRQGVPAVVKEDAVRPGHFDMGVESYVKRADRYRRRLRRID